MMNSAFKNICEFGREQGLNVFGAVKVQCPVWVLHLKMKIKDDDPFFPVDKAILSYVDMQPNVNFTYLANLVGLDKDFVMYRVKELKEAAMLVVGGNANYALTSAGRVRYFSEDGNRPEKTIYGDLVLDGLSLRTLDKEFYAAKAPYRDRRSNMIVPATISGPDDPMLLKALERIEKMTGKEKEEYLLDRSSHDYEVEGCELKSIDNVYVVLSYDSNRKTCRRDIYFRNRFIPKVDSLATVIDNYYLSIKYGECHSSEGYDSKPGNPFTAFRQDGIKDALSARYGLEEVKDSYFRYDQTSNPEGGYPLTVIISEDMLENSGEPSRIMGDALAGYFEIDVKEGSFKKWAGGFCIVNVENHIPEKVARYKSLKEYVRKKGHVDMNFIESNFPSGKGWRREFVSLGLLEELEDIDIQQFINDESEKENDYE